MHGDHRRQSHMVLRTHACLPSILHQLTSQAFYPAFWQNRGSFNCSLTLSHWRMADRALFLAGRYNKYSRAISQTPWLIDGKKKVTDSVEDFIKAPIVKLISAQSIRFSSSGREDVDVRMLGEGRPFVIEMIEPDHDVKIEAIDLNQMIKDVSSLSEGQVTVKDLRWVTRADVNLFRKEDTEKKKCYSALCCASRPISQEEIDSFNARMDEFIIYQKTPTRVLHRRPLATRERTIYSLVLQREADRDDRYFTMTVETEAGAYVKEMVHSDFGRTKPSLGDLLGNCRTDIISLDVADVKVQWPPQVEFNETAGKEQN